MGAIYIYRNIRVNWKSVENEGNNWTANLRLCKMGEGNFSDTWSILSLMPVQATQARDYNNSCHRSFSRGALLHVGARV